MKPIRIRYSDFFKHEPIKIIIKDIKDGYIWNKKFIVFDAFFSFDNKIREFEVMFPYYPFIKAYWKLPVGIKLEAGTTNIQMVITKLDRGKMKIQNVQKWKSKS
mgnify:CR=1 FL=1